CGALQCSLQIARFPILVRNALAQLFEPPYTDPYVRWCGRGGAERLPPIPISFLGGARMRLSRKRNFSFQSREKHKSPTRLSHPVIRHLRNLPFVGVTSIFQNLYELIEDGLSARNKATHILHHDCSRFQF